MAIEYEKLNAVRTFTDLINISRKHFEENLSLAEYDPLDVDGNARNRILQLYEIGILPYSAQPYRQSTEWYANEACEIWQKPFVSLVVTKDSNAHKLLQRLKQEAAFAVYEISLLPYKVLSDPGKLVVAQRRSASSVRALQDAVWETEMTISARDPSKEDFFSLDFFRHNETRIIDVAVTSWGVKLDLLELIVCVCRGFNKEQDLHEYLASTMKSHQVESKEEDDQHKPPVCSDMPPSEAAPKYYAQNDCEGEICAIKIVHPDGREEIIHRPAGYPKA